MCIDLHLHQTQFSDDSSTDETSQVINRSLCYVAITQNKYFKRTYDLGIERKFQYLRNARIRHDKQTPRATQSGLYDDEDFDC